MPEPSDYVNPDLEQIDQPQRPAGNPGNTPDPLRPRDPAGPYGPVEHHVPGDKPVPSWEEQIAEIEGDPTIAGVENARVEVPKDKGTLPEKAKVVASSVVTLLSGLAVFLTLASPEIAQLFPESAEDITRWSVVIVGWLGTAVAALRRVTPVPGRLHGILPDPKIKVPS